MSTSKEYAQLRMSGDAYNLGKRPLDLSGEYAALRMSSDSYSSLRTSGDSYGLSYVDSEDFQQDPDFNYRMIDDLEENLNYHNDSESEDSYTCFDRDDFLAFKNDAINQVVDVTGLTNDEAYVLLFHFGWNRPEVAINKFVEKGDELVEELGLYKVGAKTEKPDVGECLICFDQFPIDEMFALSCDHHYCLDCWNGYLTIALQEGTVFYRTKCPNPQCNLICIDSLWTYFLSGDKLEKYKKYFDEAIIESFRGLSKFCPAPNCGNSLQTARVGEYSVECKCGFRFCYDCADYEIGEHAPTGCEEIREWLKKNSDESENLVWMLANTKKCPECNSHIEKNGGCMHMTCKKCRHEFCWLCFGAWSCHSDCNKSEDVMQQEEDAEKSKNELEHYMFFFHRYDSHFKAMRSAEAQKKELDERGNRLTILYGLRPTEFKFLEDATRQVYNNRNMLKNSYVYAFNFEQKKIMPAEKNLFEYLQSDLERHTDHLSELLESNIEEAGHNNFYEWKEAVINYTNVCHTFLLNFIEGAVKNSLISPDGEYFGELQRLYFEHIDFLSGMGIDSDTAIPLLARFNGNVQAVIEHHFYQQNK